MTDFNNRLQAQRAAKAARIAKTDAEATQEKARRQRFFQPLYGLFDELATAGVHFPKGPAPTGEQLQNRPSARVAHPYISILIDDWLSLHVSLASGSVLAYQCYLREGGSIDRTQNKLTTIRLSQVSQWLAEIVAMYEYRPPRVPTLPPPPEPEPPQEGRTRIIDLG